MTAIGSTAAVSHSALSRVALRADIARYEKQLSDCVNCASASTPEGKRNIQDLDSQISALKAQLKVVPPTGSTASPDGAVPATASSAVRGRIDVYV